MKRKKFGDAPKVESENRGLNEYEAAHVVGVSVALMRMWRWKRTGPTYRKLGRRVIYLRSDLLRFVRAQPVGGAKK